MVVNLSYSFIPLQKILQKGVDHPVENPRKRIQNIKMAPNASNKFYWRMRQEIPFCRVTVLLMNAFRFCNACLERRNEIRANWEHIYIEHSYRTGVHDVSLFRSDISLLVYYNTFIAELQEGNLQGELDLNHGSERLVYYCPFDFVVGTFPDRNRCRRGGRIIHYETYFVKVVCATTRCHNQLCRRLFPTFVITMYPHIGYN